MRLYSISNQSALIYLIIHRSAEFHPDMNKLAIKLVCAIFSSIFIASLYGTSTERSAINVVDEHNNTGVCGCEQQQCPLDLQMKEDKILSRRKRYLAFPPGSSFSVAFCASIGYFGNPSIYIISWQFNWGIAYDLPNQTWIINEQNRMRQRKLLPKQLYQRRHRRELYRKLETAVDSMGYNGRECILRALCESSQYFQNKKLTMIEELTRTVFTLPSMKVLPFEHEDLLIYDAAFREGQTNVFCPIIYPDCNLSLIKFALGGYLTRPKNFM